MITLPPLLKKKRVMLAIALAVLFCFFLFSHKKQTTPTVSVERGTIVEEVIAVGQVEPEHIAQIKSSIPGAIQQLFVKAGDQVVRGQKIAIINPSPTPSDFASATNALATAKSTLEAAQLSFQRYKKLYEVHVVSAEDYEQYKTKYQTAQANEKLAEEQLNLLKKGQTKIAGKEVSNTIYSPMDGYILTVNVNEGDSVVPVTEYQSGTALFTIANMNDLVFRGQVDQSDVMKLKAGMSAKIELQALTNKSMQGQLSNIALMDTNTQSSQDSSSSGSTALFDEPSAYTHGYDIEVNHLQMPDNLQLRAGLQGTSTFEIEKLENIMTLPQNAVYFEQDKSYVCLAGFHPCKKQYIQLGISDAMNVQVISGLKEHDKVEIKPEENT